MISEQHAVADARVIRLRTESNSGPGAARNLGLLRASGTYVFFLDADDVLPGNSLQVLYEIATSTGSVLVRGALADSSDEQEGQWTGSEIRVGFDRIGFRLLEEPRLWIPYFFHSYLYSREFLRKHDIAFPDLRAGEDPVFLAKCLVLAPSISATSIPSYTYRRDGSSGQPRNTLRHARDFLKHVGLIMETYIGSGHRQCWYAKCESFMLDDALLLLSQVQMSPAEKQEIYEGMRKIWPQLAASSLEFAKPVVFEQ
jgi:hypothetical protein